jgi:hypothetical protein
VSKPSVNSQRVSTFGALRRAGFGVLGRHA